MYVLIRPIINLGEGIGLIFIRLHHFLHIPLRPYQLVRATACPHLEVAAEHSIEAVEPDLQGQPRANPGVMKQVCEAAGSQDILAFRFGT